jgi:hypothetical protein
MCQHHIWEESNLLKNLDDTCFWGGFQSEATNH